MLVDMFEQQTIVGIKVRSDQRCRRCENDGVLLIGPGKWRHAGELRCVECGKFVGWLPAIDAEYVREKSARAGWGADEVIDCRPVGEGPLVDEPPINPDEYFDPSEYEDDR